MIGGIPLIAWLVIGLAVSVFSWFALHTIVPMIMILSFVGVGVYLVYIGGTSKEFNATHKLVVMGIGTILVASGLLMYKPTAGYTLSIAQTFSVGDGQQVDVSANNVGWFDTPQLLSFQSVDDVKTEFEIPEWYELLMAGTSIAGIYYANRTSRAFDKLLKRL